MKLAFEFINRWQRHVLFAAACICMIAAGRCLAQEADAPHVKVATGALIPLGEADVVFHVAPNGNDTAAGNATAPLKTIGRAVTLASRQADLGKNARILVNPGVYREEVRIHKQTGKTPGTLTIEAAVPGKAIISGADIWQDGWSRFHVEYEDWKWHAEDDRFRNSRIFRHDWPYDWKMAENPWGQFEIIVDPIVKHTEMVFMNDIPLRPVMSFGELREGTFHVNTDVKKLYVWPPAGLDPQTALTEVSIRTGIMDTGGRYNLVLRGLVFSKARAMTYRNGLLINGSHNVLVENCRFEWNGWNGTGCSGADGVTYSHCVAEHNAIAGMGAYQTRNLLIEDCVDAHNNWRGRMGGFVNWGSGTKFFSTRQLTIRRHKAFDNASHGLWIDTDNRDILLDHVELKDNLLAGTFLEASQGPIEVRDCTITGNQFGVLDGRSDNVTLLHNHIFNNRDAQILFSGDPKGRSITEFDTKKQLFSTSRNYRIEDNDVETDSKSAFLVQVAGHIPNDQWAGVLKTLHALNNTYAAPVDAAFCVRNKPITLEQWQQQYAIDQDSHMKPVQVGGQ